MTGRETLPNRRRQESIDFTFNGVGFTASIGRYPDGRIGEVFLECEKTTASIESVGRDAAIVLSIALQHGARLDSIRDALTKDQDGGPASVVGKLLDIAASMGAK